MRRFRTLAALAVGTLLTTAALPAAAGSPTANEAAAVTAVRVVPGAGRADVVLSLSGDVTVADFTLTNPHRIVVDVRGATMQLRAPTYDRVSRAGIMNVRLAQFDPNVVRLVLDLDGAREYSIVHADGELRISVTGPDAFAPWSAGAAAVAAAPAGLVNSPTSAASAPEASASRFEAIAPRTPMVQQSQAPRINVEFNETPIREVIGFFASFSGRTIITGSTVSGNVTANIPGQPWDVALSKILQANGLSAVEDSTGIIMIDSYRNLAARVAAEPLVTRIVPVNYAKAAELAVTIRQLIASCSTGAASTTVDVGADASATPPADAGAAAPSGGAASPGTSPMTCGRGTVAVEEKTNTLLITESVSRLPEIVQYIADLDKRTPQVAIRAKIISVDRTGTEELGISYDIRSSGSAFCRLLSCTDNNGDPVDDAEVVVDVGGDAFIGVANANRQFGQSGALNLLFSVVTGNYRLSAFIDALSSQSLSDVQAEPSTTTVDNRKATLFAGTQLAYLLTPPPVPGQIVQAAATISRLEIGITLEVTPHVTANRQIAMEISATQQSLIGITQAGPTITERRAINEVLVGDGETAVIAGLTQTQVTKTVSGIPYLMKLPWIGRLFSQTRTEERKQDLLILVTPHIIDEGEVIRR